jgi:hypothetical protein
VVKPVSLYGGVGRCWHLLTVHISVISFYNFDQPTYRLYVSGQSTETCKSVTMSDKSGNFDFLPQCNSEDRCESVIISTYSCFKEHSLVMNPFFRLCKIFMWFWRATSWKNWSLEQLRYYGVIMDKTVIVSEWAVRIDSSRTIQHNNVFGIMFVIISRCKPSEAILCW